MLLFKQSFSKKNKTYEGFFMSSIYENENSDLVFLTSFLDMIFKNLGQIIAKMGIPE